jgi:hypothetical protein
VATWALIRAAASSYPQAAVNVVDHAKLKGSQSPRQRLVLTHYHQGNVTGLGPFFEPMAHPHGGGVELFDRQQN